LIAKFVGKPLFHEMVDFHSSRPGHDLRYALDGTKLAELGWTPKVNFEDSLERVVNWSLSNPSWLAPAKKVAA
jgi:dTDP-glucose 4,6-dehydratase